MRELEGVNPHLVLTVHEGILGTLSRSGVRFLVGRNVGTLVTGLVYVSIGMY